MTPIYISNPQLGANQGFRIRTRPQYGTTWTDQGVFTSNSVSLDLAEGCYEVEIYFLRSLSPLIECDPITRIICVEVEQPCVSFTLETFKIGLSAYKTDMTVSPASPAGSPCGGYAVYWRSGGATQRTVYASLPSVISYNSSSITVTAEIYAIDCLGNEILCDSQTVIFEPEPCTPLSSVSAVLNISNKTLTLTFTPSNPSGNYYLSYNQCSFVTGVPDSGTLTLNSTIANPVVWVVNINPNMAAREVFKYCGTITDECNFSTNFTVQVTYP